MSTVRLYRNIILTPLSNSSPGIAYFTPTKIPSNIKKSSNYLHANKFQQYPNTKSAERFRKREKAQKRRTYQYSPHTPNYIRYKSIKRRLVFDDTCMNDIKNSYFKNSNHSISKISKSNEKSLPLIKITSPVSAVNSQNENLNLFHKEDQNMKTVETMTPNIKSLIMNILPFENHQVLGRGRFGIVLKTEYKGRKVAVKYISKYRRFYFALLNERNGVGLNHLNVVDIELVYWSLATQSGIVVMKCYDNAQNLQTVLDDESFLMDIHKIIRFPKDICHAIQYLHLNNVLHLDVKPKNILLLPNGLCKLCDFGSSTKYYKNVTKDSSPPLFQGTVYYCAPEILKGKHPTPASDIYSLGITMWQIIHRTMPFDYKKCEETLIYQIVKYNLRPFIKPSLSSTSTLKALKNIYTTCWNADVSRRPSTISILQHLQFLESNIFC